MYSTEEMSLIRVPPDERYAAEVVVLVTTLGVKRHEYNQSNKARDLLEICKCHFKVIDFNLDSNVDLAISSGEAGNVVYATSTSRVNQGDLDVIRKLYAQKKLMQDPQDGLIVLPQILIDGVNIGDCADLQALIDEDLLENMLLRHICPKCLRERKDKDTGHTVCRWCDEVFQQLMPDRQTIQDVLSTFRQTDSDEFVLLQTGR